MTDIQKVPVHKMPAKGELGRPGAPVGREMGREMGLGMGLGMGLPFDQLRRDIEQVFDNFRMGGLGFPLARGRLDLPWPRLAATALTPAIDVVERENAYEITAELPGMDEKDIEVKLASGNLLIRGEKKDEREENDKDYYVCERRYGTFTRAFKVPEGVDPEKVEARFSKGILTVILPKSAEARRQEKTIQIKAA